MGRSEEEEEKTSMKAHRVRAAGMRARESEGGQANALRRFGAQVRGRRDVICRSLTHGAREPAAGVGLRGGGDRFALGISFRASGQVARRTARGGGRGAQIERCRSCG